MLTDTEIMDQVLAAFREEQAEHRQAAGEILLTLERRPDHPQRQALLDQLFREAHSLKGGARAAGQPAVEQIAHAIEDVFSAVRQGRRALTPDVCDPVYAALDAIGALMNQVAAGQLADLLPFQPQLAALANMLEVPVDEAHAPPQKSARSRKKPAPLPTHDRQPEFGRLAVATTTGNRHAPSHDPSQPASNGHAAAESPVLGREAPWEIGSATVRLSTAALDGLLHEVGELLACTIGVQQLAHAARTPAELPARWHRIWRQTQPMLRRLQMRAPAIRPTVHYLDGHDALAPLGSSDGADRDTAALIAAVTQANALIADLEQRLAWQAHQAMEAHTRLHAVTDRLHAQVRRTRMLPLTTVFGSLRLQMREMARAAGKQVVLDLDDGGAEADRQVLERLGEVLLHLVRNAVDHGIESADARHVAGKSAEGRIVLRAIVSGDRLTLTIADDGAGLDLEAIRQCACDGGHVSSADLARMSEGQLRNLIFLPGFSTRQTVSALSGRGVGLDIVRTRVERMRGRVTVHSSAGAGCTFTLSLPLSLASVHGLLLQAGGARYVLPLDAVQRIVSVAARDVRMLEGRAAIQVDDRPLALVQLTDLLGRAAATVAGTVNTTWYGLLLGSGERQVVCLVDSVLGEQELMVQRLPPPLQRVPGIAGATILADGTVVPILDEVDLLRAALGAQRPIALASETAAIVRRPTVLVVDDSITTRTLEKEHSGNSRISGAFGHGWH